MELTSEEKALILKHRKAQREKVVPTHSLNDYTDDIKIHRFDHLYKLAESEFQRLIENGYNRNGPSVNYKMLGRKVMAILGDDIFEKIDTLAR